ncbi:MAG TPA: hypothetical protein VL854_13555 [Nitrososphaeraceae archaeon]|jgi:hypothetical protein|nr:hypothetical protein [Nitrososphaeraceae archaeon]
MDLDSKMLLVLSIVLIIGAVIGASVARVFADDPFKNIGKIDDEWLPAGVSDKVRIFPYPQSVMKD